MGTKFNSPLRFHCLFCYSGPHQVVSNLSVCNSLKISPHALARLALISRSQFKWHFILESFLICNLSPCQPLYCQPLLLPLHYWILSFFNYQQYVYSPYQSFTVTQALKCETILLCLLLLPLPNPMLTHSRWYFMIHIFVEWVNEYIDLRQRRQKAM